eukprot:scaffold1206_cov388-Prasinococcus_capsulatus_cf.AAC.33
MALQRTCVVKGGPSLFGLGCEVAIVLLCVMRVEVLDLHLACVALPVSQSITLGQGVRQYACREEFVGLPHLVVQKLKTQRVLATRCSWHGKVTDVAASTPKPLARSIG